MSGVRAAQDNGSSHAAGRPAESFEDALLRLRLTCNALESLMRVRQWGPAERKDAAGIACFLTRDLPEILVANEARFRRSVGAQRTKSVAMSLILEDHNRLLDLGRAAAAAIHGRGRKRRAATETPADAVARYLAAQRHYNATAAEIFTAK